MSRSPCQGGNFDNDLNSQLSVAASATAAVVAIKQTISFARWAESKADVYIALGAWTVLHAVLTSCVALVLLVKGGPARISTINGLPPKRELMVLLTKIPLP